MKQSISLGPNFFQQEKRNYSNWKTALIREVIQNAADSVGCTRIDFSIEDSEDSTTLTVRDNGAGMSRDVLQNVFLVMGETTKNSSGFTGGFGKARVLIAFAQREYTIISGDYICEGSGAEYSIRDNEYVNGCTFIIKTEKLDWTNLIKGVLDKCSLTQSVYINGERYSNTIRRGRLVRELSFGLVYVNKSANSGVHIRVNGTWMFSKYSNVSAQVCVELNSSTSRDVLTANRDGLQFNQDNELQAFLNELSADSKSALKDKTRHFKKFVNKNNCFRSVPKSEKFRLNENNALVPVTRSAANVGIENTIRNFGANPIDREYLPVYQTDPILASMMVLNGSNDVKTVNLIKNFYMPEKWDNRSATRYQLLRQWFAVCNIVMDELSNMTKKEFGFAVGWVFSDNKEDESASAVHLKDEETHYLLLNPIDNNLKLKYSVNNIDNYYALITLACHEAAHCLYAWHDENFSSLFTNLMIKVLARRKEIVQSMKDAKN